MNRKRRFYFRKPQLRLYDTTGLTRDVQLSLNTAIVAVMFAMVFTNITTGPAWTGFQRKLGADAFTLGILSAVPVIASTLQIVASYILERWRARRTLFLAFGITARLCWLFIALIPVLIPGEMQNMRLTLLMALLAVSAVGASFLNVSFYSLMGDIVPLRIRGRYFSARQAVSLIAGILAGLGVSLIMDRTEGFTGYCVVLAIASLFGVADICFFFKVKWPPMQKSDGPTQSFRAMIKSVLKDREYMRIVLYFTFWFFSVNISAPFLNVYFLEHVKMTFTEITVFNQIVSNFATVLVISWWGRKMDQYGNQPIVQTAGLFCMIQVLTYLFTGPRSFAILPFVHILSGMAWPASDLGQQNMYLAKAPEQNRSMYVAIFFASTQLFGTALSNFVGGILMNGPMIRLEALQLRLFGFEMLRYHFLFIISGILRMICVLGLLSHLRQETDTPAKVMWKEIAVNARNRVRHYQTMMRVKRLRKRYRKENERSEETD